MPRITQDIDEDVEIKEIDFCHRIVILQGAGADFYMSFECIRTLFGITSVTLNTGETILLELNG